MATMNFSVPNEVKDAFNKALEGENKSAILSRLMRQAVDDHEKQKRRIIAINAILGLRAKTTALTDDEIHDARMAGRP